MNSEEYLRDRLQDQIDWYDRKSSQNQRRYTRLRLAEIVLAAAIPLLGGVAASVPALSVLASITVALVGMAVTIIAGALSLGQHQEKWVEFRATCEGLKREKLFYLTGIEPYVGPEAFARLVQTVESLISKESTNWAQFMLKQGKEPGATS